MGGQRKNKEKYRARKTTRSKEEMALRRKNSENARKAHQTIDDTKHPQKDRLTRLLKKIREEYFLEND